MVKKRYKRSTIVLDKPKESMNSIIAIDRDNLKIAEYNGSLEKETQAIREKFSTPTLIKKQDIYMLYTLVGADGYLFSIDAKNLIQSIKKLEKKYGKQKIKDRITSIIFGTEERRRWYDSLSSKELIRFKKSIIQALRNLHLSYALFLWMENYVLYNEKRGIDENDYYWAGYENFALFGALLDKYPLTTVEKKLVKKVSRNLKTIKDGKSLRIFTKEFIKKLKTLPPRRERRKRRLDKAMGAIEAHGKIKEGCDEVERKPIKIKMTDRELAAQLFPDEDDTLKGAKKIKKLRQRYKTRLKK